MGRSATAPPPSSAAPSSPSTTPPPLITDTERPITAEDVRRIAREEISTPVEKPVEKYALALADDELVELRSILNGMHISTARDLINAVRRMAVVRIKNAETDEEIAILTFPEDTLTRFHSRLPLDTDIVEYMQEKFTDWIEMYVNGGL